MSYCGCRRTGCLECYPIGGLAETSTCPPEPSHGIPTLELETAAYLRGLRAAREAFNITPPRSGSLLVYARNVRAVIDTLIEQAEANHD